MENLEEPIDDDIQHLVYRSDVSTRGLKRTLKFHHIGHFLVDGYTRNGILLLFKQLQNDSLIFKSRFDCRHLLGQFAEVAYCADKELEGLPTYLDRD